MIENIKQILKAYNRVRSSKEADLFFLNYRKVFDCLDHVQNAKHTNAITTDKRLL